jgi:hypothetical protein
MAARLLRPSLPAFITAKLPKQLRAIVWWWIRQTKYLKSSRGWKEKFASTLPVKSRRVERLFYVSTFISVSKSLSTLVGTFSTKYKNLWVLTQRRENFFFSCQTVRNFCCIPKKAATMHPDEKLVVEKFCEHEGMHFRKHPRRGGRSVKSMCWWCIGWSCQNFITMFKLPSSSRKVFNYFCIILSRVQGSGCKNFFLLEIWENS